MFELDKVLLRIDEIERKLEINIHPRLISDEIENGYIKRIGHLGNALDCLSKENEKLRKIPHKCPVCEGLGNRYNDDKSQISICHSCEGKGIVWN